MLAIAVKNTPDIAKFLESVRFQLGATQFVVSQILRKIISEIM